MGKKKYLIEGEVTLKFCQEVELTEEEANSLDNFTTYQFGRKEYNILYDNIIVSDYDCKVDEYDLFNITEIND